MSATPSLSGNDGGASPMARAATGNPWRILLIELINLLGIFFKHARHAKGTRATTALFDQMMRLMDILDKMPGNDGGLIIRRIGPATMAGQDNPDYFVIFGNQAFRGRHAFPDSGNLKNSSHYLISALDQAFACFHEQGIFSFYMQLPGKNHDKIDQLRLALNITARFRTAVEHNASVTFHYYGRTLTVPLIRDTNGRPNPNLTLVAGLNSISAVNMRELVKQAVAFCNLLTSQDENECTSENYNKIFSVRSLRSQLIQPLVEINNLPWMKMDDLPDQLIEEIDRDIEEAAAEPIPLIDIALPPKLINAPDDIEAETADLSLRDALDIDLSMYLEPSDRHFSSTVDTLFQFDFETLTIDVLGNHIGLVTKILNNMRSQTSDASIAERFLVYLHERLVRFPETVLDQIQIRRQGLKIEFNGRTMIVGMAHPRLMDLITLAKERVAMQRKIAAFRDNTKNILTGDKSAIMESFALSPEESGTHISRLRLCFDEQGHFDRKSFINNIDEFYQSGQTIFEMLWCILRYADMAGDRLAILNSLPLLVERLRNTKAAVNFLLADLLQNPVLVEPSDRNAFVLCTQMLRTYNKERNVDIHCTPEEVIAARKSLNHEMVHFVATRLDMDRNRIIAKFNAIRNALQAENKNVLKSMPQQKPGINFLLSLEREGFIFLTLVGGNTAHLVLRNALVFYGDPASAIYQGERTTAFLYDLMVHLRVILRGMSRLGRPQDLELFKKLEQSAPKMMALDSDPSFPQQVKRTLDWVTPAIRAIQVQLP